MNGVGVQEARKMTAKQFQNNSGAKTTTTTATTTTTPTPMESSGQEDESIIRFSPSSPFVTMRHYISEFDPDESSTYMSMNALKLAESWKIYLDTFTDLCDIDKVPTENRRKLLLLLAGNKLRRLLSQLESGSTDTTTTAATTTTTAAATTTTTTTLEETVRILTQHFENRRAIQMARFSFFYGSQNRRKEGESITNWTSRLIKLSEKCQFSKETTDGMTVNDALMVVMYKQSQDDDDENGSKKKSETATMTPKSAEKTNGRSSIKTDLDLEVEDEDDEDDGMPVELEWGEEGVNADGPQVLKLEVETFQYTNGDRTQPEELANSDPRETPDRNFSSPGENLTHADMDLLRRARGGPCICPNCTLFPKRRAGKHNCHIAGCGREYSKTSHLRAHLVSHCNVLPFACSWVGCGKRFYRTDQLTRHARIHTGEKKFACQFCEHAFSRSDHLTKHLKRHSNANQTGSQANPSISGVNANNHNRNNGGQVQRVSPGTLSNVPITSNNITAAMVAHQQQMTSMPPVLHYNLPIGQKTPAQFSYH